MRHRLLAALAGLVLVFASAACTGKLTDSQGQDWAFTCTGPTAVPSSPSPGGAACSWAPVSPSSSPSTSETPSPTPTTPAPPAAWPNPANTGTPAGWVPVQTRSTGMTISQAGQVVEDVAFTNGAGVTVNAPNVVVRRSSFAGGVIVNNSTGLLVEDVSFTGNGAGQNDGVIKPSGYTARRVEVNGPREGLRIGANNGPVVIEDTFIRAAPPVPCGDWHGDGVQAYGAGAAADVTVHNVTIHLDEGSCGGTAPWFHPRGSNQGNSAGATTTIDRLLVVGGGFSFRQGSSASVNMLRVASGQWGYGPVDVYCPAVSAWEARSVPVDSVGANGNYQPTGSGTAVACTGDGT